MEERFPPFEYRLSPRRERVAGVELTVETLANLDETIDQLFLYLREQGREEDLEKLCPYFGVVWPSARALTETVASKIPTGTRVLELGCGLAVPSLFLALKGAQVTATDFHPEVPRFLALNLARNGLSPGAVRYRAIDWQSLASEKGEDRDRYPWVIGSDILYERRQPELVADAIDAHLEEKGRAIVADPARPYIQPFVDEMTRRGYSHRFDVLRVRDSGELVPPSPSGMKDVFVVEFWRG